MSEREHSPADAGPVGAPPSGVPAAADLEPAVARVLALQRSAGNAAVGRMLARQGESAQAPPADGAAAAPAGGALLTDGDSAGGAMPVPVFLARVRATLASADGAERLEPWLARAAELDAAALEQALRELAPRAAAAATGEELVAIVCEQLQAMAPPEQQPAVQTKRAEGATGESHAPADLLERLGPGEALPSNVRSPMEAAFEQSFADVRVHRDEPAAAVSRELSARAFAVGSHVAFGAGEYAPGTPVGDALLAHELAHVQQQRGADAALGRKGEEAAPEPALEEDADRSAVHAVASLWGLARTGTRAVIENAMPRLRSGLRLNRCGGAATQIRPTVPGIRIPAGPVAPGDYGAIAAGAPPTWTQDVAAARSGAPAARFALVQTALPGLTVVDKTADCASDAAVNAAHLVGYDASAPTVSYDDNLNSKAHRANNAGFTKNQGARSFVVLGPKALDDNFYLTRMVANHEFDHVRQNQAGSALQGPESEVDAWTSTFCRDFHRNYIVHVQATNAFINHYDTASSLLGYYEDASVGDPVRQDARRRIREYYTQTVAPHPIHTRVFKWWIFRTIQSGSHHRLADELNADLSVVSMSATPASLRQFPAAELAGTTVPGAPTVNAP